MHKGQSNWFVCLLLLLSTRKSPVWAIQAPERLIKRTNTSELAKNWPQCASNHSALATSVTNSAFLAMPVDYTYLLGHVLFACAHNCHCMTGNGRQQALYCAYTAAVCFTAPWILNQCRCYARDMCSREL